MLKSIRFLSYVYASRSISSFRVLAFMTFYRDWILKYFLGNHLAEDCYRQDALKVG